MWLLQEESMLQGTCAASLPSSLTMRSCRGWCGDRASLPTWSGSSTLGFGVTGPMVAVVAAVAAAAAVAAEAAVAAAAAAAPVAPVAPVALGAMANANAAHSKSGMA